MERGGGDGAENVRERVSSNVQRKKKLRDREGAVT